MQKNGEKPITWNEIEKKYAEMHSRSTLASETISWLQKVAKSKDLAIICMTITIIVMSIINHKNNRD